MKNTIIKTNDLILLCIAVLMSLSTFSGVFRLPGIVYIVLVGFFFLYSFFRKPEIKLDWKSIWLFVLICILSLLINRPNSYFRAWERLLLLLSTLLAFSPLIVSHSLNISRISLYDKLLKIMILFSVASFVGYFFGINFFVRDGYVLAYNEAGHFSGFTNHSMVLAPISAMGGIYALSRALTKPMERIERLKWLAAMLLCFGSVLLSASRGALAGTVLGVIVIIYRHNAGHMGGILKYTMIILAILAITIPFWGGLTQYVVEKNDYNMEQGGIIYSREDKMAARLYEIRNNPFSGVGFCVVDETVDYVDHSTGTIEPNSSWLGVFSMTGVFGFLIFLSIFVHAFITAYKKIKNTGQACLLCGILGFFFVHMMIEGYVLAAGSLLCGMYWLTIGVVHANVIDEPI